MNSTYIFEIKYLSNKIGGNNIIKKSWLNPIFIVTIISFPDFEKVNIYPIINPIDVVIIVSLI